MSNTGKQFGTDVERKITYTNSDLFRAGMNFVRKNDQILYSYGEPQL